MLEKVTPSPLFLLLFVIMVVFAGCGDDSAGPTTVCPSQQDFSFRLSVVDSSGAPMSGLRVSRVCHLEYVTTAGMMLGNGEVSKQTVSDPQASGNQRPRSIELTVNTNVGAAPPTSFFVHPTKPNPAVQMNSTTLDLPQTSFVQVTVLDWQGNAVMNPMSVMAGPGTVTLIYNNTNLNQHHVWDGLYQVAWTAWEPDTSAVLFEGKAHFSSYSDQDPCRESIGYTGTSGIFTTNDREYFPSTQSRAYQISCDTYGAEGDMFRFSDIVTISVHTDLPPNTPGVIYWMSRDFLVSPTTNRIKMVFAPDDSLLVVN